MISKTLKTLNLIKEKNAIWAKCPYFTEYFFFFFEEEETDLPSSPNKCTNIKPDYFSSVVFIVILCSQLSLSSKNRY